jgi:hypothetical protein
MLKQKLKSAHVVITILLAISAAVCVGLSTSLAGSAVQVALISATTVFFAVVTASIAILTYLRR